MQLIRLNTLPGPFALVTREPYSDPRGWEVLRVEWADESRVLVAGEGPSHPLRIVGRQLVVEFGTPRDLVSYRDLCTDGVRSEVKAIEEAEASLDALVTEYRQKIDDMRRIPDAPTRGGSAAPQPSRDHRDPRVELYSPPSPYGEPS